MKTGLDWYKREPQSYLGGVQGLSAKEHAVYSVVLDLIYVHGGKINNDPKWVSGWISDMGAAAVRTAILSLVDRGKLFLDGDQISQKRAQYEAKTKSKLTESRRKSGEKGGKKSAELRAVEKENNNLDEPIAGSDTQAEKIREENTIANAMDGDAVDGTGDAKDIIWSKGRNWLVSKGITHAKAGQHIGKWLKECGSAEKVRSAINDARAAKTGDPVPYITAILNKPEQLSVHEMMAKAKEINANR